MKYYLDKNFFFITCRTINKEKYFEYDYQKQIVLDKLKDISYKYELIAYSILSNHYHVLIYLNNGEDLKVVMQSINGGISYNLNRIENVNRSIWDKYCNSNVADRESYMRIIGYIAGNPFKHGLVENIEGIESYKYCNYKQLAEKYGREGLNAIIYKVKNLNWEINLTK